MEMVVMDKSLLILDDDAPLRGRLRRAMEVRGFEVTDAGTVRDGINIVRNDPPAFAILDMKLEDGTGLTLVQELRKKRADCRIVMLTGFGNIATAVAAVKAGALDYLQNQQTRSDQCCADAVVMKCASTSRPNECGSRAVGTYPACL